MSSLTDTLTLRGERGSRIGRRVQRYAPIYLSIAPFYVIFAVFGLFPILFSIYLSFQRWDGMGKMFFVGLNQYIYLVNSAQFWQSIVNTIEIWVVSTVPMLVLALIIAFLLNAPVRLRGVYRIAFFLPNITSIVAVAIIFGSLFATQFGLLNDLLGVFHVPPVAWLTTPWGIKVAIASMIIWRWAGYNSIIYLAGLQGIPAELYEVSRIDGAGPWRSFLHVTLPLLRPVVLFTVITSTIGGLQVFTEPQVLVGDTGGAGQSGMTMVLYLYQQAFGNSEFGYGAAIGWALFVIIVAFSLINWLLLRRPAAR